ncbi:outer membrane beta-barrel family protein [Pontimicrobium aquaticum]|uniref:TonB-dependent receptor n=1 Tax=Pontimicrobium aquaticum TaxID=2565367 RepID=A0A4U0ESQ3_9FLAO|nr:outer membrane beta-barrel family protein [Pontimicrobium aquaticum]TJY34815.1 TonB-dependent receptor [Pontimicrobium aquaticum]
MKIFFKIISLLTATTIWSQSYTVSGNIIDESNRPVAYSNILLLRSQDSTIVSGTTSNDDGKFSFNDVLPNNYILKASFIGYIDSFSEINISQNTQVPSMVLKESIEALSEIELVYKKPTLKREVDRLVFNVEKTALSEGNLMEVLRNTPSVIIMDNAITVKGSEPTVYINDRKVHISSSEIVELLQGTSASNIKSVEVITNPPARYDAESGVVLNIVMTKNVISGYNGSVFSSATQGVFPRANYGMTNYFKGENISFFANYSYGREKIDRVDKETIDFSNNQFWNTDIDRNTWFETHNANANFDWDITKSSTFSLATNMQFVPYSKRVTKSKTEILPNNPNDIAHFFSNNTSRDIKHNMGFNLDFMHRYDNNARISLNSHYTNYDFRRNQDVTTDYFLGNSSFDSNNTFKTRSDQATEIFTSQADYMVPLSENSTFEIGAKYSDVTTNSEIKHYDIINNTPVKDLSKTDAFDYNEKVFAGYISFDKSWEKWTLSTGLRAEQTNIEAKSESVIGNNNQNYLEWFPTANLGLQASEKLNIYVNYKRSISRPNYSYLNPFRYYLNDNTYVTGNPGLKPFFTDQYKLGFSINNMFVIETYYKKYKNNIFELPIQDNTNNTLAHTSVNINYTEEIGLDFEAYFDVTQKWSTYLGTSFYKYQDNATLFGDTFSKGNWSNYTILQNDFSFLKNNSLVANFTLTYIHKNVQGLQVIDSRLLSNFSIRKTIFKGKGSLSLLVSDLFNQQDFYWTTKFANQNSTSDVNLDNRYIKLGFRYKFGNTKLSTNERTSSVEERERLSNKH